MNNNKIAILDMTHRLKTKRTGAAERALSHGINREQPAGRKDDSSIGDVTDSISVCTAPSYDNGSGEQAEESPGEQDGNGSIQMIPIDEICLNPSQPRKRIDQGKLRDLSDSIKHHGLLQPVIVTKKDGLYHLVVGERRLRAAKMAELIEVPAIVKEMAWDEMLKVALVENLQREDLSPLEEAVSYQMLISEHNLTQEQVADTIGHSRPYVTNMLRLMGLPFEIKKDLESGELTLGHAKAILGLTDNRRMLQAASRIKKGELSVRQAEELVRRMKEGGPEGKAARAERRERYGHLSEHLSERLATRVSIKEKGKRGKIEINYDSDEELERILSMIGIEEPLI